MEWTVGHTKDTAYSARVSGKLYNDGIFLLIPFTVKQSSMILMNSIPTHVADIEDIEDRLTEKVRQCY